MISEFKADLVAAKAIGDRNYDLAIKIYENKLSSDRTDTVALNMLALCYEWKGEPKKAINYIDQYLNIDSSDFDMLIMAAKYWLRENDEERVYQYACRAVDNPPEAFPDIPEWLFVLAKPLSLFFKMLRNIKEKSRKDFERLNNEKIENLKWAKNYKEWYEKKNYINDNFSRVLH